MNQEQKERMGKAIDKWRSRAVANAAEVKQLQAENVLLREALIDLTVWAEAVKGRVGVRMSDPNTGALHAAQDALNATPETAKIQAVLEAVDACERPSRKEQYTMEMMTPEQKMQAIVELAGECWHGFSHNNAVGMVCFCGEYLSKCKAPNPSPADLNELFHLADKLGSENDLVVDRLNGKWSAMYRDNIWQHGDTAAEALLKALYEVVKVQKSKEAPQ